MKRTATLPRWLQRGIARTERERKANVIARPMRNLMDMLAQGEVYEIDGRAVMRMPEIDEQFATRADTLRAALASTRAKQATIAGQLERITAALTADDGPAPATILRRARELETEAKGLASDAEQIKRFARLLETDDEIHQADIDAARACATALRNKAGELTLREARAFLDETCIKIEVERAGLVTP